MESKNLLKLAEEEKNDFKAYNLACQALRKSRSERFIEDWLPVFKKKYSISEIQGKYTFTTEKYGVIDFFPKANKVLIRKENNWHQMGLSWLIKHLTI
jgi:hypothetical protein